MAKEAIKTVLIEKQEGLDALSGKPLAKEFPLVDTDRIVPKLDGGTYDDLDNVRILDPVEHMKRHGIYRERSAWHDELKSIYDARAQVMKLKNKINNQLLAYQRNTDHKEDEIAEFLEETNQKPLEKLKQLDKQIEAKIKETDDPLVKAAMGVAGLGHITVGMLTVYVDLEKAPSASSLWSYVGYDRPNHERGKRDEAQMARRKERGPAWYGSEHDVPTGWGGNRTLRTQLYVMATNMIRLNGKTPIPYVDVYNRTKARLAVSEKLVKTYMGKGKLVEVPWREAKKGHRAGAGIRALIKHVLADYWFVGRELAELPTRPLYAEGQLGHTGIIRPRERGWNW